MERVTRRTALLAVCSAAGLAGCLDELPGGVRGNDDGNGGDDDGDGNGTGVDAVDVFQLGPSNGEPLWATVGDATGFVTLLESTDERTWMVEDPDRVAGLEAWLAATDFEASTIVYLETAGPNTCFGEIDVGGVAVEGDEIVGSASAVDAGDGDEGCGMARSLPSAFVRVTGEDLPSAATFDVTDGWGESGAVTTDGRIVDPAALPGRVRPAGDPETLASLSCDDDAFQRHWAPDGDVELGEAPDEAGDVTFAMRVHTTQALAGGGDGDGAPRVGRGHEVRVSMWNVTDEPLYTGNRHKYNLQVRTADGWQDVRGWVDGEPLGYTDEAIVHRPGEGFEWAFEMTEDGVLEGHVHEERLEVCPDLQPGRYRFCYHEADRGLLAVEFDYVD